VWEIASASKNNGFAMTSQKKYQLSSEFVKAVLWELGD
jgi:hypothetical protein